uniref:DNA replication complex GINS protein SLD5 n=1 Tax=Corethron hystrix TaxID=216773 RepID=A0A7S1BFA1_9STRA|mmetsp:Transcript_25791/g.59375  ORF Transcript_25791/g.59375 Transcript_25791/m.59375 type:complete len:303 (+) Transcript_25791:30-938(+)
MADFDNLLDFPEETEGAINDNENLENNTRHSFEDLHQDGSESNRNPSRSQEVEGATTTLAEVRVPRNSSDDDDGGSHVSSEGYEGEGEDSDFLYLLDLWTSERSCPELLPYGHDIVDLFKRLLDEQEEKLSTSSATKKSNSSHPSMVNVILCREELGRIKYILTDYLRLRLKKIERFALFARENWASEEGRMSPDEVNYLRGYGTILEGHLSSIVLQRLPDPYQSLTDPEMIDGPDLDEYVFCKVGAEDLYVNNSISLSDGISKEGDNQEENAQVQYRGRDIISRYACVREYIMEGKVMLLP